MSKFLRLLTLMLLCICVAGCTKQNNVSTDKQGSGNNSDSADREATSGATFTNNNNGTVTFSYLNENSKKCKVIIQHEADNMYQYDIPTGQCDIVFPLSQGNGVYKVYLCINSRDNKYSILESASFTLELEDENLPFLASSYIIDWNETNEAVKEAQRLVKGKEKDQEKLEAIYDYIVTNYSYDFEKMNNVDDLSKDGMYLPNIDNTYAEKKGICYDISTLAASMLRSVSIPAKVVTGYCTTTLSYHAWNNVFYSPKADWKILDMTYDIQRYQENKKIQMFKNPDDYLTIIYTY